jgi:hypothetical protein
VLEQAFGPLEHENTSGIGQSSRRIHKHRGAARSSKEAFKELYEAGSNPVQANQDHVKPVIK